MKKYLIVYAVLTTALLVAGYRRYHAENSRLKQTQAALADQTELFRNRLGEATAQSQALRLRIAEFERLRADDAARIRSLGIRLRRVEAAAKAVAATTAAVRTPLRDTVVVRLRDTLLLRDTVRMFRWRDAWISVEGQIADDSVCCRVESVDTLHQIVYRVPRRFLFIRWGTKALRQEISSSNPHTRIVAAEYVKIER